MREKNATWTGAQVSLSQFRPRYVSRRYLRWLNDPEVVRYSRQRFLNHGFVSSFRYLRRFPPLPSRFLAIRELETGRMIGTLTVFVDVRHGVADIGIMIGEKSRWGSGLGLDAWRTAVDNVQMVPNIRKITAGCLSENLAMMRIMESSGMHLEAIRRSHELFDDRPVDLLLYALFTDR